MMNFSEYTQHITCQTDTDHPCLTCSDEAVAVRVVQIEPANSIAFVEVGNQTEEVDTMLVEDVALGDLLLVHGGVALARLEEGEANVN